MGQSKLGNDFTLPAIIIGLVFICCTLMACWTLAELKGRNQIITVTGAGFKPITSDFSIWEGLLSTSSETLESAYAKIKADLTEVNKFMRSHRFDNQQVTVSTVRVQKHFNRERLIIGYTLSQTIKIELDDVPRLTQLAKDASSLIEKGINFESRPPRYLFTGLNAMKLEMIRLATENAKLRAEELARSTGRKVGAPRSAKVGVFQIRPLHSQRVTDYGINDVTSIEKEIVCTVHISFSFD